MVQVWPSSAASSMVGEANSVMMLTLMPAPPAMSSARRGSASLRAKCQRWRPDLSVKVTTPHSTPSATSCPSKAMSVAARASAKGFAEATCAAARRSESLTRRGVLETPRAAMGCS